MQQLSGFSNYFITIDGKVWSKQRIGTKGKWIKPNTDMNGYLCVRLYIKNKRHRCHIHRLVLETYVGPCPKGMECRHLNGDKQDNRLDNLCWGTRSENQKDAVRHGTHTMLGKCGEICPNSKLSNKERQAILDMYNNGGYKQKDLAMLFNVSRATICRLIHYRKGKNYDTKIKIAASA